MADQRSFWGWGYEGAGPSREQTEKIGQTIHETYGADVSHITEPPKLSDLDLPASRVTPPDSLAAICANDPFERAGHTYGKSFRDIVRGFQRDFSNPPDLVTMATAG